MLLYVDTDQPEVLHARRLLDLYQRRHTLAGYEAFENLMEKLNADLWVLP